MAYCSNCGNQLRDGAKFCDNCGFQVGESDFNSKRQTVFEGNIHKCPNCGEVIDAFTTECPACGYELRSSKSISSIRELSQKLEETTSSEQKIDIISSFYIPNTKEDIYEFAILAAANIKIDSYAADAWYAKLEQTYKKAELSIKDTQEFLYISKLYKRAKRKHNVQSFLRFLKRTKYLFLGAIGIIMAIYGYGTIEAGGGASAIIGVAGLFGSIFALMFAMNDKFKNN